MTPPTLPCYHDPMTVSGLYWAAVGSPPPPRPPEPYEGLCGTCGAQISRGIPAGAVLGPGFSGYADYLRFGDYLCEACAYMHTLGRSKPGNFLLVGHRLLSPMISHASAKEAGRPTWLEAIAALQGEPGDTPVAGVLTTDPKPRLWPRARVSTAARPSIYVHAPDYDLSELVDLDPGAVLNLARIMAQALRLGWTKTDIYHGLYRNYRVASKRPTDLKRLEAALSPARGTPMYAVALLVTSQEVTDA